MTLTATYADDFSRVRLTASGLAATITHVTFDRSIDSIRWEVVRGGTKVPTTLSNSAPLNTNTGFETDTSGWTAPNGTITRSTAQARTGVASGLLEPNGTSATVQLLITSAAAPTVVVGNSYTWSAWVYSPAALPGVQLAISWRTAANAIVSEDVGTSVTLTAGQWTQLSMTATAPATAEIARPIVQITGTPAATVDLFVDDAELRTPLAGVKLDDYEFIADVANTYRASYYNSSGAATGSETVTITPTLTSVWLKSVPRPFLNLKLPDCGVSGGSISRKGRGGVFDVVGRTNPVAVSDVRSGIEFTLNGATATFAEAKALDYLLMSGDILFIHAPSTSRVPTIHAFCGDSTRELKGSNRTSEVSSWLLPMTEVAKPGAFIVGTLATYRTVTNKYATYTAVLAAHATYASLLDLVADPSEVVIR